MKKYSCSLFIFHRDLRLDDNNGLLQALEFSDIVIPCFVFDPRQVEEKNSYKSQNALQFMIESLHDLESQLAQNSAPKRTKSANKSTNSTKHIKKARLYLFYGITENVIAQLLTKEKINAVFCNRDYTPFSLNRDEAIAHICHANHADFVSCADALTHEPEAIASQSGTPYTIFTAFYKKSTMLSVPEPKKIPSLSPGALYTQKIELAQDSKKLYEKVLPVHRYNKKLHVHGGRQNGLVLLKELAKQKNYAKTHDYPAHPTTNLSAHLKFGTISIREAYQAIKKQFGMNYPLIRQLYWRDFFTHVAYHSPFVFGQPYHEKYKNLPWSDNKQLFDAWCAGNTGFPIVDAGMRQLNQTGFMHNRVRMVVASFLTKDLHINWLWGEKYFAQKLVDYDPAVNNGNWQWAASTGCGAQPYFRIFNPWLQQKRFDPQCTYIKQWIPELKNVAPKIIHRWFDLVGTKEAGEKTKYPRPIVDHAIESKRSKLMYKNCSI